MQHHIHRRLQSRISKRRNFIRAAEAEIAIIKRQRHQFRESMDDGDVMDVYTLNGLNEGIRHGRAILKEIVQDQILDKQLKNVLVTQSFLFGYGDY